jgi:hypothetical protein
MCAVHALSCYTNTEPAFPQDLCSLQHTQPPAYPLRCPACPSGTVACATYSTVQQMNVRVTPQFTIKKCIRYDVGECTCFKRYVPPKDYDNMFGTLQRMTTTFCYGNNCNIRTVNDTCDTADICP